MIRFNSSNIFAKAINIVHEKEWNADEKGECNNYTKQIIDDSRKVYPLEKILGMSVLLTFLPNNKW